MTTPKYRAIPDPTPTTIGLMEAVAALKENVEVLTNQRKHDRKLQAAVTWQDLVDLELIAADQVPR